MSIDDVTRRERTISGALALAMHVLFIVLLIVGISWQPKRTAAPVAVELWSELPPAPRPKAEPVPPPEPPRPPPRPEPRPEPKPELKPVPKPDIALREKLEKERQRLEAEKRQLEEQKKKEEAKRRAEEERKQAEIKKREEEKKRLAEEKKREEEKRKLAEQKKREEEKKRLAAEKLRKEQEAKVAREREEQLSRLLAQQAADAARSRLDAYSRLVADRIKRYIVEPPNVQGNPEAIFVLVQIPGGEILDLRLKRSSGNPAYDAAVERAIRRASPLPPPSDPARFSEVRELELRFRLKE